jgi:hypothetical protein
VETEDVGVVVVVVLVVAVRVFVVVVFDLPPHAVPPSASTMRLTAMASCPSVNRRRSGLKRAQLDIVSLNLRPVQAGAIAQFPQF